MKCLLLLLVIVTVKGDFSAKIVGGTSVTISEYPYQAALINTVDGQLICGAVIVSARHLITAGHCISPAHPHHRCIRLGATRYNNPKEGRRLTIISARRHPSYDATKGDYNIAVVEVDAQIAFNANTAAIALATAEPSPGSYAWATGWGSLYLNGRPSTTLRAARLEIVARDVCAAAFEDGVITPRMLCSKPRGWRYQDTCDGDDGGALAANGSLYGITDYGMCNSFPQLPSTYVNLANKDIADFVNAVIDGEAV